MTAEGSDEGKHGFCPALWLLTLGSGDGSQHDAGLLASGAVHEVVTEEHLGSAGTQSSKMPQCALQSYTFFSARARPWASTKEPGLKTSLSA